MRLIDADALKEEMCDFCTAVDSNMQKCKDESRSHECMTLRIISEQPTIDAEPVRRGHWKGWTKSCFTGKYKDFDEPEFKDYNYYQCSLCYRKSAIKELYCPSCGAKMDGGDEDD